MVRHAQRDYRRLRRCGDPSDAMGRRSRRSEGFAACRHSLRQVADDSSRWRGPGRFHGLHAVRQNGSAASELAADAHYCIMVWVSVPTAYKDVARAIVHHMSSSPTRAKCAVVLGALKDEPFGGADAPSLTAPARCRRHQSWVGMKKRARPGRTKKLRDKKMDRTLGAPP